jgi:hypothetical protein
VSSEAISTNGESWNIAFGMTEYLVPRAREQVDRENVQFVLRVLVFERESLFRALAEAEQRRLSELFGVMLLMVAPCPAWLNGKTQIDIDNYYLQRLPVRSGGKGKTNGILIIGEEEYTLISGTAGPAANLPSTRGFNIVTKTHVEGHAVAIMRQGGVREATLYINNIPCSGVRGCDALLPRMLPTGATLRVVGPSGFDATYVGQ